MFLSWGWYIFSQQVPPFRCIYFIDPLKFKFQVGTGAIEMCFPPGMPVVSGGGGTSAPNAPKPAPAVLPQVQKNELPSNVVLKYMDGITKRISKLTDACYK